MLVQKNYWKWEEKFNDNYFSIEEKVNAADITSKLILEEALLKKD